MDKAKVKAIQKWEPLSKVTELRSFLNLVNYYRCLITNNLARATPLTELLKSPRCGNRFEGCSDEGITVGIT